MKERHGTRSRYLRPVYWLGIILLSALIGAALTSSRTPSNDRYAFITANHPIDVVNDRSGQWFYYMPERAKGGAAQLAATVRMEVLPRGFTEDRSNKPWYRFVKGEREVIVCYHDEIATNGSLFGGTILHETLPKGLPRSQYPVLWVHQPGSDIAGSALFQAKKLLFRW